MTTVVLGWDGLDHRLAEEFDLADAFGEHNRKLSTFDNPALEKPHTYELWPSIITGVEPEEHGIHAASEGGSAAWGNPAIALAARVSQSFVPEPVRTRVGRVLRSGGAGLDFKPAEYYREKGIETVFDGRRSRAIAVPNYGVERDDRLGFVVDRGADLGEFLDIDGGEETSYSLRVSLPEVEERLVSEATGKLGSVRACVEREYDLIFVWLGYLDTVGHLAPTVDEAGWQERAYRLAARLTGEIHGELSDDDVLVCVSDHGLRDGYHTHDAYVGASDAAAIEGVESVLDVRGGIDRVTDRREPTTRPAVRPAYRCESEVERRDADDVREQLEDMGYL